MQSWSFLEQYDLSGKTIVPFVTSGGQRVFKSNQHHCRFAAKHEFDMVAMETVSNQYLGGDTSMACSPDTQKEIDKKSVELVKRLHEKAKTILLENRGEAG